MDFETFIQSTANLQNIKLPSLKSHQKMAPSERIAELLETDFSTITYREAAVLILFYPKNDQTHLVLIERNEYKGIHSKQISLPGGKKESFDKDLQATALRETFEEVGVDKVKVLSSLSSVYVPPSNFMVFPFMGTISTEITFKPDVREVRNVIEVPLSTLLNPNIIKHQEMSTSYAKMVNVPYYEIDDYVVWGATAMILSELIDLVNLALNNRNL